RDIASVSLLPALRRQPFPRPAAVAAEIAQPIVQAARASLPELVFVREHAKASPPRRPGNGAAAVRLLHPLELALERLAALDRPAWFRGIHAVAALERTRGEVAIGFVGADALDAARHAHLPLERAPEEEQARPPCGLHLVRLPALVVGEEHEA